MKANRPRLEQFVALLREGLNPSESARRLGYARGPSSWSNGSKLLRQAREMDWVGPDGKPRPEKPARTESPRLKLPPSELRAVQRMDAEQLRRQRLAEFLAVPVGEIPELERADVPECFLRDRMDGFRGMPPPRPERMPLALTYADDDQRAAWRKRNFAGKGWLFVVPILPAGGKN